MFHIPYMYPPLHCQLPACSDADRETPGSVRGHLDAVTLLLRLLHCCITSTETIRISKDGEPRTATETFTELLTSDAERRDAYLFLYISYILARLG